MSQEEGKKVSGGKFVPVEATMNTILLIDDSRFLRSATQHLLTKSGYRVVGVGDGQEALRVVGEVRPDLILLDMLLPVVGGPEVLQSLKKNPSTAPIPVVVLTSLSRANEAKLKQDGAAAFLEKSQLLVDSQQLLDTLRRLLPKREC